MQLVAEQLKNSPRKIIQQDSDEKRSLFKNYNDELSYVKNAAPYS